MSKTTDNAERVVSLAAQWREDAARHRVSCRWHEGHGDRGRADRHYQRSLDLDACAAALETELRAGSEANAAGERQAPAESQKPFKNPTP